MLDLAFLLLLIAWSAAVGLAIVRRLDPEAASGPDRWAFAVPMGLGALAMLAFGLAEIGRLGRADLLAAGGITLGLAIAAERRRWRVPSMTGGPPALDPLGHVIDGTIAAVLAGSLLVALTPPTDGDALCYHLQVPKLFLWNGGAFYDPDLHETVYPLVTESLYAVALLLRGPVACRLVQWAFGLTFATGVSALGRPWLGERARWAGAVALAVPAVSNGMGAPLNDVALAAFATASLAAWCRWCDRPTPGRAALAGTFAGLAMGVKYPGLVWSGVLGVGMLSMTRSIGVGRMVRHASAFGASALLVGACWYVRAWWFTGNPVHPFFREVFGSGLDVVLAADKRPMEPSPWNLLTALVPMTLDPDRFDSWSHQFGPAFLLFLPAMVLYRAPRRLWAIVGVGYAFLTLCLTQRQSMRFVLPCVGPMAVGVAWMASRWRDRSGLASRLLMVMLAGVLALESAIAIARARHGIAAAIGLETHQHYLARREPTYRVGRWIDANLPPSSRIIGQDHRGFYIPRPYAMEKAHRRRTGLGALGESPEAIIARLRDRGFTHLLLCPPQPLDAVEFDPALLDLLGPWTDSRRPLYRDAITDPDGVTRTYAVYDLAAPPALATGPAGVRR